MEEAYDPRVASASNSLHRAYSELMRLYPSETKMNKQAFFDYFCAGLSVNQSKLPLLAGGGPQDGAPLRHDCRLTLVPGVLGQP